jgi:hypothetical protein
MREVPMPKRSDLKLFQRNTATVREAVTDDDTEQPVNLTGKTIEFLIKATDTTPDASAVILSTATGEVVITDALGGICTVAVPAQQPGEYWRRLDVVDGIDRKTAIYGPMHVISV